MPESNVPESWIGRGVVVLVGNSSEPYPGTLREVNDRGIVMGIIDNREELAERRNAGEDVESLRWDAKRRLFFFPWHRVRLISRPEDQDEG